MAKISIGDTVRMTGKFLRNTGQQVGGEGQKRWTVKDVQGSFAVVDEEADTSYYTAEEMERDPSLKWRRINIGNLEKVKGPSASRHESGKNPTVRGKHVKNLGWLLRNWKSVEHFEVRPGKAGHDAYLIAHLSSGGTFESDFASRQVLLNFLDRPVFRGAQVSWFGKPAVIGRKQPSWIAIADAEREHRFREGEATKKRWEEAPTIPISTEKALNPFGYQIRHDVNANRWYVLRNGSLQTNERFESREAAIKWALGESAKLGTKVGSHAREAKEALAHFDHAFELRRFREAYDWLWNKASRELSAYEVYSGEKHPSLETRFQEASRKLHNVARIQITQEHPSGFMTVESWRAAGFPGAEDASHKVRDAIADYNKAKKHESGDNPSRHEDPSTQKFRVGEEVESGYQKKRGTIEKVEWSTTFGNWTYLLVGKAATYPEWGAGANGRIWIVESDLRRSQASHHESGSQSSEDRERFGRKHGYPGETPEAFRARRHEGGGNPLTLSEKLRIRTKTLSPAAAREAFRREKRLMEGFIAEVKRLGQAVEACQRCDAGAERHARVALKHARKSLAAAERLAQYRHDKETSESLIKTLEAKIAEAEKILGEEEVERGRSHSEGAKEAREGKAEKHEAGGNPVTMSVKEFEKLTTGRKRRKKPAPPKRKKRRAGHSSVAEVSLKRRMERMMGVKRFQ
jgi:hypothetical protein